MHKTILAGVCMPSSTVVTEIDF